MTCWQLRCWLMGDPDRDPDPDPDPDPEQTYACGMPVTLDLWSAGDAAREARFLQVRGSAVRHQRRRRRGGLPAWPPRAAGVLPVRAGGAAVQRAPAPGALSAPVLSCLSMYSATATVCPLPSLLI